MQNRKPSPLETVSNLIVVYLTAVSSQFAIFPLFGIIVSTETHLLMGSWFAMASMARTYLLRRILARWEGQTE